MLKNELNINNKNNIKMKNLVIFLVLLVFATSSEVALGQTRQDRAYIAVIDDQISDLESELKALKKDFKKEKKEEIYDLKNKLREAERLANQKPGVVARSIAEVNQAKQDVEFYREQIKEAEAVITNLPIGLLERDLAELKEEKRNYRYSISESDRIPREMSYSTKNRRLRSNVVRREELTLAKIENNINQAIVPVGSEGGYKVIFDNLYSQQVTFILRGMDGGQRMAVALQPRTMESHYVIPGRYSVEYVVGGRKLATVQKLTVDGEQHWYKSIPCFGFVYKAKY